MIGMPNLPGVIGSIPGMSGVGGILAAVQAWLYSEIMLLVVYIIDGIISLIIYILAFIMTWLLEQLHFGIIDWLHFPVVRSFFSFCRAIGLALFIMGMFYSVLENTISYHRGNGMQNFQSVIFNTTKALFCVLTFTVIPPLFYAWSVNLTQQITGN